MRLQFLAERGVVARKAYTLVGRSVRGAVQDLCTRLALDGGEERQHRVLHISGPSCIGLSEGLVHALATVRDRVHVVFARSGKEDQVPKLVAAGSKVLWVADVSDDAQGEQFASRLEQFMVIPGSRATGVVISRGPRVRDIVSHSLGRCGGSDEVGWYTTAGPPTDTALAQSTLEAINPTLAAHDGLAKMGLFVMGSHVGPLARLFFGLDPAQDGPPCDVMLSKMLWARLEEQRALESTAFCGQAPVVHGFYRALLHQLRLVNAVPESCAWSVAQAPWETAWETFVQPIAFPEYLVAWQAAHEFLDMQTGSRADMLRSLGYLCDWGLLARGECGPRVPANLYPASMATLM